MTSSLLISDAPLSESEIHSQIKTSLILLLFSLVLFESSGLDILVQNWFYSREWQMWILSEHAEPSRFFFYSGVKKLFILFTVIVALVLLFFKKKVWMQTYRQGLWIVLFSLILVPLLINGLKGLTNIPCPRDIWYYNGDYPYATVFHGYPKCFQQPERMRCYPAGHASGGFALLSLFFFFRQRKNRQRAIVGALTMAWMLGIYKMTIGDHFLSHTITAMLLSWVIILLIAKYVYRYFARTGQELAE